MIKAIIAIAAFLACFGPLKAQDSTTVPIVGFEYVQRLMQQNNDTTYVLNFWATWCRPCVEELPYFDGLVKKYPGKKLKVVLVSLDFKKNYNGALLPYLKRNKVASPVVLLYEPDANGWINKVSTDWSGAIPATLIFKGSRREFFEKQFEEQELYDLVEKYL